MFKAKYQITSKLTIFRDFNDCLMTIKAESIIGVKKNSMKNLVLVDVKNNANNQDYKKQRVCGAYIISIFSLKAILNESIAVNQKNQSMTIL